MFGKRWSMFGGMPHKVIPIQQGLKLKDKWPEDLQERAPHKVMPIQQGLKL